MGKQFNTNLMVADTAGTGFWRMTMPATSLETTHKELNISIHRRFVIDPDYFKGTNLVMVQRQVNNNQEKYFNEFLYPLSKSLGFWTIYNIDDVCHKDDIPKYNKAWASFQDDRLIENINKMVNNADFMLVTTNELKDYYNKKYNVPLNNILVIPNFLPYWWFGHFYNVEKSLYNYNLYKKRPRIGIISSPSHFNQKNSDTPDDLDMIIDLVEKTVNKFKWVMFGSVPKKLEQYIKNKQIEIYPGCDIYAYPGKLNSLNLQAIVAPLQDNVFNRCKSNIKLLEGAAIGVPVLAQDLPCYSKYTTNTFNSNDELLDNLSSTVFNTKYVYRDLIKGNYNFLFERHYDAPNGWWFENNKETWLNIFKMRSRPMELNFEKIIDKKNEIKLFNDKENNLEITI